MSSAFGLSIPSAWQVQDGMVYQIIDFFVFGLLFTLGAAGFCGLSLLDSENVFWEGVKETKFTNGTIKTTATKLSLHKLADDTLTPLNGADVKQDAEMVYTFVMVSFILLLIATVARWVYHSRTFDLSSLRSTQLRILELFHLISVIALLAAALHVFSDLRYRSEKAVSSTKTEDAFYDLQTYGPGWWFVVIALASTALNFLWSFALVTNIAKAPDGDWRREGVNIGVIH